MRIASTAALTALTLVVLAHGGVLACGSSDSGTGSEAGASTGGAAPVAGAGGAAVAGASTGGSSAGASAGGSAGASAGAPSAAGAGGSVSGAGGLGGGAGSGGAGGNASGGAAGSAGSGGMGGSGGAVAFALTSTTFEGHADCSTNKLSACGLFPKSMDLQAIGGMNMSPELDWTPGPAGTMSYAISLFDESNMYPHWVVWNIPAATMKLPASLPGGDSAGGITGLKQVSFNGDGSAYAGPGANSHVYLFKVYALKTATIAITLPGGGNKQQAARSALEASKDVIGSAMLRGATNP